MEYSLVWIDPTGDSHTLVTATIHPLYLPTMILRVGDLARYIPGLAVVTMNHQVTELRFTPGMCKLRGEPVNVASDN